jgi:hypothetical protein
MTPNYELERIWKEAVSNFKILYPYLSGWTDENNEKSHSGYVVSTWFIIGSVYNATSTNWSTLHSTTPWLPVYKML